MLEKVVAQLESNSLATGVDQHDAREDEDTRYKHHHHRAHKENIYLAQAGGVWGNVSEEAVKLRIERVRARHVIRRTGKICGNHHLGVGAPRTVSLLKGANMIYRRSAVGGLRFDTRLRGKGAQPCNDLSFSLSVRRTGWKMVYDPRVAVDHFPAERFDDNGRDIFGRHFLNKFVAVELFATQGKEQVARLC